MKANLVSTPFIVMFFLVLTACDQDEKKLSEAREEGLREGYEKGRKVGYDSAISLFSDTTIFQDRARPVVELFDPPYDGHVHSKSIQRNKKPQVGLMYLTLREDHKPEFYLDFFNSNGLTFKDGQTSVPGKSGHGHFEYDIIWIKKYDTAGNVIARAPLALNLVEADVDKQH